MQTQQKTTTNNKTAPIKALPSLQISNGKILTYNSIRQFIQNSCGGSLMLCNVVPLPNCNLTAGQNPTPFGFTGGKGKVLASLGGVRSALINWHIHGYKGNHNLSVILNNGVSTIWCGKKVNVGHSKTSPIVTLALLNGGFTPTNNANWGTSFIKLQAINPLKKG